VNRRKLFLQGGTQMLACQIAVDRLGRRRESRISRGFST
jgi:hypothetical protein